MAVAIAVTGSAVLGFEITITDATEGDRLRVTRIDNDGYYPTVAVRGVDLINPSSATEVFTDYEAPFNADITYLVETFALSDMVNPVNTDTATGLDTTVPTGFAMIMEVLVPENRVAGAVLEFKGYSRKAKVLSSSNVLGRKNPVVVTDVMGGREGTMSMGNIQGLTFDYDDSTPTPVGQTRMGKWRDIFESGGTLLFRSDAQTTGVDDFYFKCENYEVERLTKVGYDVPSYPILRHEVSWVEVDAPLTTVAGLGLESWADVMNSNADWQEVNDDHADWESVLTDPTL